LFFGIFLVVVTIIFAYQSDDVKKIVIQDPGEVMGNAMADSKSLYFTFSDETLEELKVRYNNEEFDGILVIPPVKDLQSKKMKVQYLSDKQLDPESNSALESELEKKLRKYKIRELGFDQEKLASLDVSITIDPDQINKKERKS